MFIPSGLQLYFNSFICYDQGGIVIIIILSLTLLYLSLILLFLNFILLSKFRHFRVLMHKFIVSLVICSKYIHVYSIKVVATFLTNYLLLTKKK